jgi:hypothetical protein
MSGVRVFGCSGVRVFRCSGARVLGCSEEQSLPNRLVSLVPVPERVP